MRMCSTRLIAIVTIVLACVLASCLGRQAKQDSAEIRLGPEESFKHSDQAHSLLEERTQRIRVELAQLGEDHPWAGEYYFGDGLGQNVRLLLAPHAGFTFTWHGCLGLYDLNYGEVQFADGKLFLQCELINKQEGFQGIATELVPVTWGSRHYLVASSEMVQFCNAINAGGEPRGQAHGFFLLRAKEYNQKVTGWPNLPEQYLRLLRTKPLTGMITRIHSSTTRPSRGKWNFRITSVTLNVGKAEGVYVGMEFYATKPEIVEFAEVTDADEHSCTAEFVQVEGLHEPKPAVGWEVSTTRWPLQDLKEQSEPEQD